MRDDTARTRQRNEERRATVPKKHEEDLQRFQAILTVDQYEKLRKLAFHRRVSITELLREAVDAWLRKQK